MLNAFEISIPMALKPASNSSFRAEFISSTCQLLFTSVDMAGGLVRVVRMVRMVLKGGDDSMSGQELTGHRTRSFVAEGWSQLRLMTNADDLHQFASKYHEAGHWRVCG